MNTIESHLKCPICKDLFVFPRLYPCGHTTCETCMAKIDDHTLTSSAYHLTVYSCPICRDKSITPWYYREENIALRRIVECHPQYTDRLKDHGDRLQVEEEDLDDDEDVDLEILCNTARMQEVDALYKTFFPLLYSAAKRGRQYVIINSISDVRRIEPVADLFANLLIEKHNIFKLLITRNECTIAFTKGAFDVGREFVRETASQQEEEIEETAESVLDDIVEELQAVGTRLPLQLLEIP